MITAKKLTQLYILCSLMLVVSLFIPTAAQAEETTPTSTDTTQQTTPETGPDQPPSEVPYVYNEETGMWENDKYAWDPETGQTKPLYEVDYSYNPDTGRWDTTEWVYDPATNKYVENTISTNSAPSGSDSNLTADNDTNQMAQSGASTLSAPGESEDNPGSGGSEVEIDSDTKGVYDLFYNATISSQLDSVAQSGDATVEGNTLAGDATTGSANAIANFINSIASYWDGIEGSLATFVADIYSDMLGDIIIDPSELTAAMNQKKSLESDTDINVNVDQNGLIENQVNLTAQSGNATVDSNTSAGDATTGDANAVANLINMINSAITSGSSFIGTVNIHGSLDGDILFPQGVLESLLASNTQSDTFDASLINNTEVLADINNSSTIDNNVNLNANSGSATVDSNTTAGDATTGDALTNLTILNLTNHQIIGSNALLVFVNVLGEWVGLIMDAPSGTTAAAVSDGTSQVEVENNLELEIDVDMDNAIVNNLNLNATTGDAAVTKNTSAGDATTGDATASANIANIINTGFSLDDWFGVLFINVFGSWFGSFGVDTLAGNPVIVPKPQDVAAVKDAKVFRIANSDKQPGTYELDPIATHLTYAEYSSAGVDDDGEESRQQVAAAINHDNPSSDNLTEYIAKNAQSSNYLWPIFGSITAMALLGTERWLTWREEQEV